MNRSGIAALRAGAECWPAGLVWCIVLFIFAGTAQALDAADARRHVEATINDIIQLAVERPEPDEAAARLLRIVERRASVQQVARFAAGRHWRSMSESEQAAFTRAFTQYLAPIIQFALGVLLFHEPMPTGRWIGFSLVWLALVIFTVEALGHRRRQLRLVAEASAA